MNTKNECDCSSEAWAKYAHSIIQTKDGNFLCGRTKKKPNLKAHGAMIQEIKEFMSDEGEQR